MKLTNLTNLVALAGLATATRKSARQVTDGGNSGNNGGNNGGNNNGGNNNSGSNNNNNSGAACPQVHVFGARETTAPPGFGTAGPVVDSILAAFPGATSEAIEYPAAGDSAYAASVQAGVRAVVAQVDGFVAACPETQVVLVGYSQGGQIMDDAICGGGDPNFGVTDTAVPLSGAGVAAVKAVVLLGDPRHTPGLSFNVGTSTAPGFASAPRDATFDCPAADIIQLYCDQEDPFCSNGNDGAVHQGYAVEYGAEALEFVSGLLNV